MNFSALPPGFHPGVPDHVYHERILGVVSKGACDLMLKSAATYKAWQDGLLGDESTDELDFGTAFHAATHQPDVFHATYIVAPAFGDLRKTARTSKEDAKDNKERRATWLAENAGKKPMSAEDATRIEGMLGSIMRDPVVGPHFRALWDGREDYIAEATVKWLCPETGLTCRAKPDLYFPGEVIDLKTTADCTPEAFNRSRMKYGYHRHEGHYRDGLEIVGYGVRRFRFLAIEKTPPYLLKVYDLAPRVLGLGRAQIRQAKLDLARCLMLGDWPGLEPGTETLDLLPWEKTS